MFYLNAVRFECTRAAFKPNLALKQNMFYVNAMFGLNARWLIQKELLCNRTGPKLNLNIQT